jgi:hypothetical protein
VGQSLASKLGLHPSILAHLSGILVISKSRYLNDQLNRLEDYWLYMNVTVCYLYLLGRDGTCRAEICLQTLSSVTSNFEKEVPK